MNPEDKKKAMKELGDMPEELYDELLAEFRLQFKRQVGEIQKALEKDDFVNARESAHSLSGTSGNLRIYEVHPVARALELSLREAAPAESAKKLLKTLEGIFMENWG